ncbi:hypothetical protein R6Q59_012810 [Mikania micrantha]
MVAADRTHHLGFASGVEAGGERAVEGGGGGDLLILILLQIYLHRALSNASEDALIKAADVAKTAANSISELQNEFEDSESSKDDLPEASDKDQESEDEDDKKRKPALERLEKASEDTFLGQGIKAIDTSVENFASGAWLALGNAWKGGSSFVQKLEDSMQQGGILAASSVLETGRAFTAKGIQVLEYVGKETMDLLITESGMGTDKSARESGHETEEDQFLEVIFDICFYIYEGPEQLEVHPLFSPFLFSSNS